MLDQTILDTLLGRERISTTIEAVLSCLHMKKIKIHPRIQVMNAFTRRGFRDTANVYISKRHTIGKTPAISGWNPVDAIDLLEGEEEDN